MGPAVRTFTRSASALAVLLAGCASGSQSGDTVAPSSSVTSPSPTSDDTGSPASTETHTGIASGRILFAVETPDTSSAHDLRVLQANDLTALQTGDATLANAVWAGDDAIVFDSERAGPRQVFRLADYRSGTPVLLTDGGTVGHERAGVSSDGAEIVVSSFDDATNQDLGIWITPVTGGTGRQLTPAGEEGTTAGATFTSFSPNDALVAYVQVVDWNSYTGGIFVVDAAGGTPRRLTPDADRLGAPRFSPDGTQLLYSQADPDTGRISLWVVPTTGGTPTQLFDVPAAAAAFEPDWSPDGSQIVFKWYESGWDHNELRIASPDGTGMRTIWTGAGGQYAETPDWGP